MSKLQSHREIIGRVVRWLHEQGLSKVQIRSTSILEELGYSDSENAPGVAEISDVLEWMLDEGLIRMTGDRRRARTMDGQFFYVGVQLTSFGIETLQAKLQGTAEPKTIEEELESADGDLAPSVYVKIGAVIGGILGGAARTLS